MSKSLVTVVSVLALTLSVAAFGSSTGPAPSVPATSAAATTDQATDVIGYYLYAWGYTRAQAWYNAQVLASQGYRIVSYPYWTYVSEAGCFAWRVDVRPF